jgi:hypothetical protein
MDELIANNPDAIAALTAAVESGAPCDVTRFARLTGTGEQVVRRAWSDGRLPCATGERIPIREGIIALVSLDGLRRSRVVPDFIKSAESRARELLGLPPREAPTPEPESEISQWRLKCLMAQTALKKLTAEAKKRENDIANGTLVPRADVELDAAECATNIIGVLARIPERAAGMCVGCQAEEIARILRREIKLAVDAIQASAFTGDWSGLKL